MPILAKWYTDESFTKRWVENPNFPPYNEYKAAVVDYTNRYSKSTSWYYVNNTVDFNNLLGSALGEVWTGTKTVRDVINANLNALKDAHQGN
jgi:multiple sugar transport system substrate-binding protein